MRFGPDLAAPKLLGYLEATGVKLEKDAGDIVYEASRELTAEEIKDLRQHKNALLDVLEARTLPRDGADILPALRAYLSEQGHTADFPARYLARNLYIFGYLPRRANEAQDEAALMALKLEDGEAVA
jgi:hypothetical protein